MTALYILGGLALVALFIFIGYYLWSYSMDEYDYNIFSIGVIIRGILAIGCLWAAMGMIDSQDGSGYVWLIASVVLWLWTFILTGLKTNFLIAFFSIVYQAIGVVFSILLIRKLIKN